MNLNSEKKEIDREYIRLESVIKLSTTTFCPKYFAASIFWKIIWESGPITETEEEFKKDFLKTNLNFMLNNIFSHDLSYVLKDIIELSVLDKKSFEYALETAISHKAKKCAQVLISAGANINPVLYNIFSKDSSGVLKDIIEFSILDTKSFEHALEIAILRDAKECVRVLVSSGENHNFKERYLDLMLVTACQRQSKEVVEFFLEKRSKFSNPIKTMSCVTTACDHANTEVLPVLAKYGATLYLGKNIRDSISGYGRYVRNIQVCQTLLKCGLLDFETKDCFGKTFLEVVEEREKDQLEEFR